MEFLIDKIGTIQDEIFSDWHPKILEDIISITEYVVTNLHLWRSDNQSILIEILNHVEVAIINKDYLYLADLLEYELKPLVVINN